MDFVCTVTSEETYRWCCGSGRLTVSGIFSGGVYMLRPDGRMLLLHDREYGAIPFGLQTEGILGRGRELGFDPDEPLRLRDGCIRQQGSGILLCLQYAPLGAAEPSSPLQETCSLLLTEGTRYLRDKKESILLPFAEHKAGSIEKAGLADPFAAAGLKGMRTLELGIDEADGTLIDEGLKGTIGLGQGLTPSYDDFLTGTILTFNYASRAWGRRHPALDALREYVKELAPLQTNPFSAAYLVSAAEDGRFSLVEDVLNTAGADRWEEAAARLLRVGSSSGSDMAAGILFAARLLKDRFTG